MAIPTQPDPVLLFIGILCPSTELPDGLVKRLTAEFGPILEVSSAHPFDQTTYYAAEFGPQLFRIFVAFERLVDPGRVVEVKLRANELENEYATGEGRTVNLDPGYLDFNKVVLASAKAGPQKVYMSRGIYADIILFYDRGGFVPFGWTFPDFGGGRYDDLLTSFRHQFKRIRRSQTTPGTT